MVENKSILFLRLILAMDEIPISKFKATCLAVLERVRRTNQPVCVTRFGKPVAEINPPTVRRAGERRFGTLRGSVTIHGDIVSPISSEEDWNAARGEWEPESAKDKKKIES
jgi:prevent-host-death family protein